jgi:hypothetical protein
VHLGEDRRPLVVRPVPDWEEIVSLACDQILATTERQGDIATIAVMTATLRTLMRRIQDPGRLAVVRLRLLRLGSAADRAVA